MNSAQAGPDPLAAHLDPGLGARVSVETQRTVAAEMEHVWVLLCDYQAVRPRILTAHFADYAVHSGGHGAGSVIEHVLRVGRRERRYRSSVEEPAPGRQLRERDHRSRLLSTWTLTPGGDGELTVIRLASSCATRISAAGWRAGETAARSAASTRKCSSGWTRT
jgi:hypothetical protein